jgi:hypothetical protein
MAVEKSYFELLYNSVAVRINLTQQIPEVVFILKFIILYDCFIRDSKNKLLICVTSNLEVFCVNSLLYCVIVLSLIDVYLLKPAPKS